MVDIPLCSASSTSVASGSDRGPLRYRPRYDGDDHRAYPAEGAKECAASSTDDEELLVDGSRRIPRRQLRGVQALVKLKSYLDYARARRADRGDRDDERGADYPTRCATLPGRRDALIEGLGRIGWDVPTEGLDVRWAPSRAVRRLDSVEFCCT